MTSYIDDRSAAHKRVARASLSHVLVLIVALSAIGLVAVWNYYGLVSSPPPVAGDPTQKIGPSGGQSVNAATLDKLDRASESRSK